MKKLIPLKEKLKYYKCCRESKHEGIQKCFYTSSVHPIMLALNSSELYALVKFLEEAIMQNETVLVKKVAKWGKTCVVNRRKLQVRNLDNF